MPLGNQSAPTGLNGEPTDPGFAHVGQVNNSTGVYLGHGWVLTADHVGAGTFTLGGVNYGFDGVNSQQVGGADLRLFKLTSNPLLAPLKLATTSPAINNPVVMIGAGRSPTSDTATTWFVDEGPDPWVWDTSFFSAEDGTKSGYPTNSTRAVRWGTNSVDGLSTDLSYSVGSKSYNDMDALFTDFDQNDGTAFESQAVTNDSGSGLFIDHGAGWELAGTIVTVGTFPGQPGGNNGASTAVFGNLTYAIDLSAYADTINGIVPEPATTGLLVGLLALAGTLTKRRIRVLAEIWPRR